MSDAPDASQPAPVPLCPGLKPGELPAGPGGTLSPEQLMRVHAANTAQLTALDVQKGLAAAAAAGAAQAPVRSSPRAAAPQPPGFFPAPPVPSSPVPAAPAPAAPAPYTAPSPYGTKVPGPPPVLPPEPARDEPPPPPQYVGEPESPPTYIDPDLRDVAGIFAGNGPQFGEEVEIEIDIGHGRRVVTTERELKQREVDRERFVRERAETLEKQGPEVDLWTVPVPRLTKVITLTHLDQRHLCAHCKHSVQIIHPAGHANLGHQVRSMCELVREDSGDSLEPELPIQYCSHYKPSLLRLAARGIVAALKLAGVEFKPSRPGPTLEDARGQR